jgi:hypothetical protein
MTHRRRRQRALKTYKRGFAAGNGFLSATRLSVVVATRKRAPDIRVSFAGRAVQQDKNVRGANLLFKEHSNPVTRLATR